MPYFIVIILLAFSGIFSGLVLGLFSLSREELKSKAKLGDKNAQKISELREHGNQLLSSLILANIALNSTLSIYLGSLTYGVVAGFVSILLIVIFGEMIPKAVFSQRAFILLPKFYWFTKIALFMLRPVAWPFYKMLDLILGKEAIRFQSRDELVQMIEDHHGKKSDALDKDEKKVITGALTYANKTVDDIYTPKKSVFMLSTEDKLTKKLVKELGKRPFSRIPVYRDEHEKVIGMLYRTDLLGKDFIDKKVVDFMDERVVFVENTLHLDELLSKFKRSKLKLFLVRDKFKNTLGVVSMEDLIEEILKTEIVDEDDKKRNLRSEKE